MSEPFIGEIRALGFDFAPVGWAQCNGQLLKVNENTALFSLLGTIYGGDGKTTFGLPDLRGRVAINDGAGPGLTNRHMGEKGGAETVTLATDQMPQHAHTLTDTEGHLNCSSAIATVPTPAGNSIAPSPGRNDPYRFIDADPDAAMRDGSITVSGKTSDSGDSQAHNNMEPYLVLNYCIALQGIYPSRS